MGMDRCSECGWSGGGVRDEGCMTSPCPRMPAPAQTVGGPDPFNRKQVEAVCRAVCAVEGVDPDDEAESCDDPAWTRYADAVAAAIAAQPPAAPVETEPHAPFCEACSGTIEDHHPECMYYVEPPHRGLSAGSELADKLDAIFDRIEVSCDWRLSSEERQEIAEAAKALRAVPQSSGVPAAWLCTDERYPYIKGIVTVQQQTVEAWRDSGIKFVGLGPINVTCAKGDMCSAPATADAAPSSPLARPELGGEK